MNLVAQEDGMGCGVACIASILEISYQEALWLLPHGESRAKLKGFSPKDLSDALSYAGVSYTRKYLKTKPKYYPLKSITYLKRSKRFAFGHYIAKTKEGWMDPWINFPNLPRKAGVRKRLPYLPSYLIFPSTA